MNRISHIGSLLKKLYRIYSLELVKLLGERGFTDLRPSFLEVLCFVCDNNGTAIKAIGDSCGLKKQTMTSHLNDLEKRGYLTRAAGTTDRREQRICLTEYGERFKFNLYAVIDEMEKKYSVRLGDVELERVEYLLSNFHGQISETEQRQLI